MTSPGFAATVVVPTHDHAGTLDLTVGSALGQTIRNVEVLVLGDGVTDPVRAVAQRLVDADSRVRFLDLPKGEHHGEAYRHRAVEEARAEAVFYLCDDDLLWPGHVESLLALLADHDLVHSLNGYFETDGTFVPYLSDLESEGFRAALMHPRRNSVSLTGTAHTVAAYRRLPIGWETTPAGRWPDHFMWQKLLALPGLRAATSADVSTVQLPSHLAGRDSWTDAQRREELERWARMLADDASRSQLEQQVRRGLNREGAALWLDRLRHAERAEHLQEALDVQAEAATACREQLLETSAELARARAELSGLLASRTMRARRWLLHRPGVAGLVRRLPPPTP